MVRGWVFIFIILFISCETTNNNNFKKICLEDVNEYTKDNGCTYVCLTNEILRVRHLLDDDNDSLFVSFAAFQCLSPELDTIFLLSGFSENFINCIIIFNEHKLYKYNNIIVDNNEEKFENGIEYKIQLNDSINVSYFFKFEDFDDNLRKMDFKLLPNMIGCPAPCSAQKKTI